MPQHVAELARILTWGFLQVIRQPVCVARETRRHRNKLSMSNAENAARPAPEALTVFHYETILPGATLITAYDCWLRYLWKEGGCFDPP